MRHYAYDLIAIPVLASLCVVNGVAIEFFYFGEMRVAVRVFLIRAVHLWLIREERTVTRRARRLRRVQLRLDRWMETL